MVTQLPVFQGYTVDVRLREFRRVLPESKSIEFVSFGSYKGDVLLKKFISTLDTKTPKGLNLLIEIWK
jgi:hypothetical protein